MNLARTIDLEPDRSSGVTMSLDPIEVVWHGPYHDAAVLDAVALCAVLRSLRATLGHILSPVDVLAGTPPDAPQD